MASYTIIGGDTKEYGPIWREDVLKWIAEGRLNAQSLAKGETDKAWRTLASFPEFADAFKPASSTTSTGPYNPGSEAEVLAREPELKIGECLAAGWSFLGKNAGFMFGTVLLTWLTNLPFVIISVTVPLLGPLVMACFYGIIFGGFYMACLRRMRGDAVSPTEVYCGFKTAFAQLLLTGLVSALLIEFTGICCLVLPAIYLAVAWAFALPLVVDKQMQFWPALELSRKVVTRVWFEAFILMVIAFLPMAAFQVFSMIHMGMYFLDLFDQANHDLQQLAQLLQSHNSEFKKIILKTTLIGQGILLLNLFYVGGVLMRAYENLFGSKKS